MSEVSSITDAILGRRQNTQQSAVADITADPDKAARALELERDTGTPASAIEPDLDGFEHNERAKLTAHLLQSNPYLTDYVASHPMASKVSNDDYANLDSTSQALTKMNLGRPIGELVRGKPLAQSPIGKAFSAFKEGYGDPWFGSWMYQRPQDIEFVNQHPFLASVAATIGAPIEFPSKVIRGGIEAGKTALKESAVSLGFDPAGAERFSREMAAMAEWSVGRGDIQLNTAIHPTTIKNVRPFAEAGIEPPVGVDGVIDHLKAAQHKLDLKNLDEVTKEAQGSTTRERSPELFQRFVEQHTDAKIGISAEAIAKLYGDKEPRAGDGKLGFVPNIAEQLRVARETGGDVEVPLADWLAKADPEMAKELHDDIRVRPGGLTATEAKELQPLAMVEAYHGTPHQFDAFSMEKVGTGEGAQSYGHGLYFAEHKEVAEDYQRMAQRKADWTSTDPEKMPPGNLYRVRIHAEKEHFLDWDKPLSEQHPHVQERLRPILEERRAIQEKARAEVQARGGYSSGRPFSEREAARFNEPLKPLEEMTGQEAYTHAGLPAKDRPEGARQASAKLAELGIPGIKYLDQGSRAIDLSNELAHRESVLQDEYSHLKAKGAENLSQEEMARATELEKELDKLEVDKKAFREANQTYNYVLFNDKLVEIVDRNGEAIDSVRKAAGLEPLARLWSDKQLEGAAEALEGRVEDMGPRVKAVLPEGELLPHEAEAVKAANEVLERILPNVEKVGARLITMEGRGVRGMFQQYTDRLPTIMYLMDPKKAVGTVKHEAIHFLRQEGFFTKAEWNTLTEAAMRDGWLGHYDIVERYAGEPLGRMIEEAIAEHYAHWQDKPETQSAVGKVLGKIKDFAIKVANAVKSALPGDAKVEDIFAKIESGEIARRGGTKPLDKRAFRAAEEFGKDQKFWRSADADYPIDVIDEPPQKGPDGRMYQKVKFGGKETYVPSDEIIGGAALKSNIAVPSEAQQKELFSKANAVGMTVPQFRAYMDKIKQRNAEDLAAATKRAEEIIRKQQTAEWKEAEKQTRLEVQNDLNQRPDIAAATFFVEGRVQDANLNRRPKLDEKAIPPELAGQLPKEILAKKGGIAPDDIAGYFGYQSGRAMVERLAILMQNKGEMPLADFVKKITDEEVAQRMEKKFGNLDENIIREAQEHVVGATQMDILHEETMWLMTKAGIEETPITKAQMVEAAQKAFGDLPIGSASLEKFLRVAGKAGTAAEKALLKEDFTEAFKFKQQQYKAMLLATESKRFEKEMTQFEKTAKRFSQREVKGVLPEYTNFIHDILTRVGQKVRRTPDDLAREIDKSGFKDLESFVESKQADLREVPIADFLFDSAYKKPIESMSVEEFRAVKGSIDTLVHNGREEMKIYKAGEAADLKEVKSKMIDQLAQFKEKFYDAEGKRWMLGTLPPGAANVIRQYGFSHLQIETILNRWDKGDYRGVFTQYVMRGLVEGANYEAKLERDFSKKLLDIADKDDLKAKVDNTVFMDPFSVDRGSPAPIIMTRKHLRAIMMNIGNASNLDKLSRGYGVAREVIMDWVHRNATKADWDYAQGLGKVFAEVKEYSDRMYRNLSGVAPESIKLDPIQTAHGTYEGWYYPVIYHPVWRGESKRLMGKDPLEGDGYFRATTPAGYTKSRTGYAAPLDLTFDRMPTRLRQMIHDIAMREPVMNASKIFFDKDVMNTITRHYGKEASDLFGPYLRDVAGAANFRDSASFADSHAMELLRQNIISVLIGYNPGTVMKHGATALVQSIKEVGAKEFGEAAAGLFSRDPATGMRNIEFAMKTSEELQRRHTNYIETFKGATDKTFGQKLDFRQWNIKAGSWIVSRADLASAIPTWLAAYKTEMGKSGIHGDAVFVADRAVRRAHGSSVITNRPAIMRTDAGWMTGLYNFFNHIMNRQYEMAWKSADAAEQAKAGEFKEAASKIPDLTKDLLSYVIIPAIIEELVSPLSNDEKESFGVKAAKGLTKQLSASWVYGRDIAQAILSGHDPTAGLLGSGYNIARDTVRDFTKERPFDKDRRGTMIQHTISAFGALTGLATAQQGKWAKFMYNYQTGQDRPRTAGDWYRAFRSGASKEPRGRH